MVRTAVALMISGIFIVPATLSYSQSPSGGRYRVEGGVVREGTQPADSTAVAADSLAVDSLQLAPVMSTPLQADSLATAGQTEVVDSSLLGRKEIRLAERAIRMADTTINYNARYFRDSIPISRMVAISMAVPGFSQLYNKQAWKIPVFYGVAGASTYMWLTEQKTYNRYKREYDNLVRYYDYNSNPDTYHEKVDPVQKQMRKYNTRRQLYMAVALGTYIWSIADGAINYPGASTSVKKATTLSTILPGAGQFYNGSYWKVPIVLGGFATLAFMVDWNNRGYQRFRTAFDIVAANDPNVHSEFYYNGSERYSADFLKNIKNNYRRNRDLCIIGLGAFYLLNVIDAHVDAQLKDYDISDDLAVTVQPTLMNFYARGSGSRNALGMSMKLTF